MYPLLFRCLTCASLFGLLSPEKMSAQSQAVSFSVIDARAWSLEGHDLVQITDSLTAGYVTDLEKVRAIFTWIVAHIAYDCGGRSAHTPEADLAGERLTETHDRILLIMKYRRAMCGGYSFLFETMCGVAGVEARMVEGKARGDMGHAWNAAKINGEWYWFDVTWASGGCEGTRFQAQLREEYFLVPPHQLRHSHVPHAYSWDDDANEPR